MRAKKMLMTMVLACFAFLMTGCPAMVPVTLSGNWEGVIEDSLGGTGVLSMNLAHVGDTVTGTWSADFAGTRYDNGGMFYGTIEGNVLQAAFIPSNSSYCSFGGVGNVQGNRIQGTYSAVGCHMTITGSLDVTRTVQ